MENRVITTVISIMIIVIVVATVLVPVIDDSSDTLATGTASNEYPNAGRMTALTAESPDWTCILTRGDDGVTAMINGQSVEIWGNSWLSCFSIITENGGVQVNGSMIRICIPSEGVFTVGTAVTVAISAMNCTIRNDYTSSGGDELTSEWDLGAVEVALVPDTDGDLCWKYQPFWASNTATIYNVSFYQYGLYAIAKGTPAAVQVVGQPYTASGSTYTAIDVKSVTPIDASSTDVARQVTGYTWTYGETTTNTYVNVVPVDYKVVTDADSATIGLISVIPLFVIIAVLLIAVDLAVFRKD